jgi:hypothetical protein
VSNVVVKIKVGLYPVLINLLLKKESETLKDKQQKFDEIVREEKTEQMDELLDLGKMITSFYNSYNNLEIPDDLRDYFNRDVVVNITTSQYLLLTQIVDKELDLQFSNLKSFSITIPDDSDYIDKQLSEIKKLLLVKRNISQ